MELVLVLLYLGSVVLCALEPLNWMIGVFPIAFGAALVHEYRSESFRYRYPDLLADLFDRRAKVDYQDARVSLGWLVAAVLVGIGGAGAAMAWPNFAPAYWLQIASWYVGLLSYSAFVVLVGVAEQQFLDHKKKITANPA